MESTNNQLTDNDYFRLGIVSSEQELTLNNVILSNSALSAYNPKQGGSFVKFKDFMTGQIEDDTKKYTMGSLVHKYLENPTNFAFIDFKLPSDMGIEWVKKVLEATEIFRTNNMDFNLDEVIITIKNTENLYKSITKDTTAITKWYEECNTYYSFLIENSDKEILSRSQQEILIKVVENIHKSPYIYSILKGTDLESTNTILDIMNEVVLFGTINGFKFKAKIDKLIVNRLTKKIHIIDYKTTRGDFGTFVENSLFKYCYDRQMAIYENIVKQNYIDFEVTSIIIPIETTYPYLVGAVFFEPVLITSNNQEIYNMLESIKKEFHVPNNLRKTVKLIDKQNV
jgi:ATP-dependent exoDNAse (exonuclease V) beta subunit